jgi:large subunit ribosomal protein L24
MKIKKGDTVKVLYGKDSGRQGVVVAVDPKGEKVIVDGLNIYKKHVKGDGRNKTSEILNIAKPLYVSKVMLVCPNCNKATRVEIKREKGKVERVCKKCGKVIEIVEKKEEVAKEEPKKESKKVEKKETKKTATKKKSTKKTTTKKKSSTKKTETKSKTKSK